jgi:hypothetical protein
MDEKSRLNTVQPTIQSRKKDHDNYSIPYLKIKIDADTDSERCSNSTISSDLNNSDVHTTNTLVTI